MLATLQIVKIKFLLIKICLNQMAKDKAEIQRAGRLARKERGLTRSIMVYIKPEFEGRLIKYVEGRLEGECPTKAKVT